MPRPKQVLQHLPLPSSTDSSFDVDDLLHVRRVRDRVGDGLVRNHCPSAMVGIRSLAALPSATRVGGSCAGWSDSVFPKAFGLVNRKETCWLIVAGILNAAAIALLYWGEKSISGGLASVLTATSPIMMAMIAFFTRTEIPLVP